MEHRDHLDRRYELLKHKRHDRERDLPIVKLVVGGLAVVGLAALIAMAVPDIKRYIKISTM